MVPRLGESGSGARLSESGPTVATPSRSALQSPDLREKFRAQDLEPLATTAAEAATVLRAETARWADVVKKANLRLN